MSTIVDPLYLPVESESALQKAIDSVDELEFVHEALSEPVLVALDFTYYKRIHNL